MVGTKNSNQYCSPETQHRADVCGCICPQTSTDNLVLFPQDLFVTLCIVSHVRPSLVQTVTPMCEKTESCSSRQVDGWAHNCFKHSHGPSKEEDISPIKLLVLAAIERRVGWALVENKMLLFQQIQKADREKLYITPPSLSYLIWLSDLVMSLCSLDLSVRNIDAERSTAL